MMIFGKDKKFNVIDALILELHVYIMLMSNKCEWIMWKISLSSFFFAIMILWDVNTCDVQQDGVSKQTTGTFQKNIFYAIRSQQGSIPVPSKSDKVIEYRETRLNSF